VPLHFLAAAVVEEMWRGNVDIVDEKEEDPLLEIVVVEVKLGGFLSVRMIYSQEVEVECDQH